MKTFLQLTVLRRCETKIEKNHKQTRYTYFIKRHIYALKLLYIQLFCIDLN